jgi:hypothetical protein
MVSKVEHIKRDNIKDFIRWAFFNPKYAEEQQEQQEKEVKTYTREVEELIGRTLPPGKTEVKHLRQCLHKLNLSHQSLL